MPRLVHEENAMIIRGNEIEERNGRKPYSLSGLEVVARHFVVRVTTPGTPFDPHQHEQPELWYIVEGQATVSLDGMEHSVAGGDLIAIEPWTEHGLRTEGQAVWICLG
jgi:quercetin dioxygenase-like cupin family protein